MVDTVLTQIEASVSPDAIHKASRLFNASLLDILHELFQNARRAGATQLQVNHSPGRLTIQDDGCGIPDPQVLLYLGQSEWIEAIAEQEDPAGMGFFSLSTRGAIIASRNWAVSLEPVHFTGSAAALVYAREPRSGTCIDLSLTGQEDRHLDSLVQRAAQFYPLPVRLNGVEVERQDFLTGMNYSETWRGLRIGVTQRWANTEGRINFYGIVVPDCVPVLRDTEMSLVAQIDVIDCPELKLVLPARKEVVHNEFYAALRTEVLCVMYRYVQTLPQHSLSFRHWQEARSLDIELPAAIAQLVPFQPRQADSSQDFLESPTLLPPDALLIDLEEVTIPVQQSFWRAFSDSPLSERAYSPNSAYRGYAWYDQLPVLSQLRCDVQLRGEWLSPAQAIAGGEATLPVEAILYTVTITAADENQQDLSFPGDVWVGPDNEDDLLMGTDISSLPILFTPSAPISVQELSDLLVCSHFVPWDEGDRPETQRSDFEEEAIERAIQVLLNGEEALKKRIGLVVDRHVSWFIPLHQRIDIILEKTERWTATVSVQVQTLSAANEQSASDS